MKNTTCCLLVLLYISILSCEKDVNADRLLRNTPFAGIVTLSGVISQHRTLSRDTLYLLNGTVLVAGGSMLTIEAGARIEAIKHTDSIHVPASLIVLKGSMLQCNGTATEPVIFTSHESRPAAGDWGGIILLGRAGASAGNGLIKNSRALLQLPNGSGLTADSLRYGGNNNNDNSGSITYTRIEYAGIPLQISPLTLCGTGSNTHVEYVEAANCRNHAFEFAGGTTNASHLIALAPLFECFATGQRYNGQIAFSLSVMKATTIDSNQVKTNRRRLYRTTDTASCLFSNHTVIGLQTHPPALYRGLWHNTTNLQHHCQVVNSVFLGYTSNTTVTDTDCNIVKTAATRPGDYTENNDYVQLISPWDHADFRPSSASPAATGGKLYGTIYRGAFEPDKFPWTGVWARFDY